MNQIELAKFIGDIFDKLGVEYMLVGSLASTYYGEARMTAYQANQKKKDNEQ